MAPTYMSAVRAGTMAAARLHLRLGLRKEAELRGGAIDVFGAIQHLDLPLLLRPLEGLLGGLPERSRPRCPGDDAAPDEHPAVHGGA